MIVQRNAFLSLALAVALQHLAGASSQALPAFDFTRSESAGEWGELHDIRYVKPGPEGLEIAIQGSDPYFSGPARDYPPAVPLWLTVRLKSEQSGTAEVFYFKDHPRTGQSVQLSVPGGRWVERRVAMPPLGPGYRLRLDPPGTSGKTVLAALRFEQRITFPEPVWPSWVAPEVQGQAALGRGGMELRSAGNRGMELRVHGESMGFLMFPARIAFLDNEQVRWVEFSEASPEVRSVSPDQMTVTARARDHGGAAWKHQLTFRLESADTIAAESVVTTDKDRVVVFVPMHLFLAGAGSFGSHKGQAVLAGLEFLEDEPSSSEADIVGPESNRRVPASHKITFPFMAVQAKGRYAGWIWAEPQRFSPVFDSPDRTFGSGGHALGVIYPGGDLVEREEGKLMPYSGVQLKKNEAIVSRAWLIGGLGRSIVPALQHYVRLRGMPQIPEAPPFSNYAAVASQGWLASKIREGNLYRHAFWPGFNPQPAADAAVSETWLGRHGPGTLRAQELGDAARGALAAVPAEGYFSSAISHVRTPVAPLVFGRVFEAVEAARSHARAQLSRFAPDGSIPYRPVENGPNYGKTHFAADANGLTAQVVASLLEAAVFCGDRDLLTNALERLAGLEKFRNTAPRGAQTWEVPLHTPDILASAHLVRAWTLGYELTGKREWLEEATYWAWTGLPFVYLINPTGQETGPYATIPVFGATNWRAPVWFGRPVQWCGIVYAAALYRLAKYDSSGPWKRLADGITVSALQQTWPANDRERAGLLPDYFELRDQVRAGPAINPGTAGACAPEYFGKGALYGFQAYRAAGLLVHAPGEIISEKDAGQSIQFLVKGWPEAYYVLVNGFRHAPRVEVDGIPVRGEFNEATGCLVLKVAGSPRIAIAL